MPKSVDGRNGEALIALVLLAIGLLAIAVAWSMPSGTVALPGPRILPTAIGLILAVTAAVGLVGAILGRKPVEKIELGHGDALLTLAMLFGAAMAFERIGAVATFAIFLCVLLRALAKIAWWQAAAASLFGAAVAWSAFTMVLGVRLPGGPF